MRGTLYGYNPIIDIVAYFNMCRQILKTKSVKNCSKWFTVYICIVLYMYCILRIRLLLSSAPLWPPGAATSVACISVSSSLKLSMRTYSRYQKQKNYIFNGFCQRIWCKKFSTVNNPFTPVQNQLSPIFVKIKPQKYGVQLL